MILKFSRYGNRDKFSMSIGVNIMGCLVYDNLSSVAEDYKSFRKRVLNNAR
jgi:hypothetical protein